MLNDENLKLGRINVIQVLGKFKVKEAIPKIIELLENPPMRCSALNALDRFKDSKFLPYFESI